MINIFEKNKKIKIEVGVYLILNYLLYKKR